MKVTDVRLKLKESDSKQEGDVKLKAVASITFDNCFVVHDIKILDGREGLFMSMPRKKLATGEYKDSAHPINTEFREEIKTAVFDAYNKALEENK